jgi:hypothetical protein
MSITICDTHLARTVRYLSLTFEPVYLIPPLFFMLYPYYLKKYQPLHS